MHQSHQRISYLATSPTFYEMMANNKNSRKAKATLHKQTRRTITKSRITANIMSFNQPTAVVDNSQMEVSSFY